MYQQLRKIFFQFEPEKAHQMAMSQLKLITKLPLGKQIISSFAAPSKNLETPFLHMKMRNPVGLGAGFDKNAKYLKELDALGFGFVEIGTVTPLPQDGNEKPRLFRLPKDKALINRMGFNNEGADAIAKRLEDWHEKRKNSHTKLPLIIGGNIGKNKITPNEEAWKDYATSFNKLHPYVDYFVVNVSSPNTPGLRALQDKDALRKIILHLAMINNGKAVAKPILLKIAPDLEKEQIDDVIDLALEIKLDGIVATNTTISRNNLKTPVKEVTDMGAGGLSGLPVKERSTQIVKYIFDQTGGKVPIIASGGIFTARDAKDKLDAGASLVQVWTGFIYEGPSIVKKICKGLSSS
ncbi:MAG: quinone-dependent dihydroorotate dehydrogenase [Niabella sp.]